MLSARELGDMADFSDCQYIFHDGALPRRHGNHVPMFAGFYGQMRVQRQRRRCSRDSAIFVNRFIKQFT